MLVCSGRRLRYHQSQPTAHPAPAPVEALPKLLHRHPEAVAQLGEQPPLLERSGPVPAPHVPLEDQRLRLAEVPDHRPDRVAPKPAERPHALVPVHQHVRDAFTNGHHHHRHLLARLGQRRQKPRLARRAPRPQRLVPQVDLVELEIHRAPAPSFSADTMTDPVSGLAPLEGEVPEIPQQDQDLDSPSGLARAAAELGPFPEGIQPLAP